ncbi:MAG: DUF2155 domain-containing protein [Pararhodobacter sp.]
MIWVLAIAALLAAPAVAQTIEWQPIGDGEVNWQELGGTLRSSDQRPSGPVMSSGSEAMLRGLDKLSGAVADVTVAVGEATRFGRIEVAVAACRFPSENPASDAYAFLTITDARNDERVFQGWMIASSPALNALDHARYDIWVLGCE